MISPAALDVIAFCAFGAMGQTQRIAQVVVETMAGVDREKTFAETLCMVATATARAAVSAYPSGDASRSHVSEVLLALPLTLHSYVAGREVLEKQQTSEEPAPHDTADVERMLTFYQTQLGDAGFPDRKVLRHTMTLWMGRISPRGLNEHPETRLERLGLVDELSAHTRLIEAFTRNAIRTA
ncbi:MAG: hypothetical protein WBW88_07320 [Rhodothermales bacterium]